MTEYHKIETLYQRDDKTHKVYPGVLKNPVYGLLRTWQWTEKIDGTNIRVIYDPALAVSSAVSFAGRTDAAMLDPQLLKHLQETLTVEKLNAVFGNDKAVLYGEGCGAGIQKGIGYSDTKIFVMFDVLVADKWWLNQENCWDVATKLSVQMVPYIGEMTLEAATEKVRYGFKSWMNGGKCDAEGMVGRPCEALFDKKGARLIVKLKTKDFEPLPVPAAEAVGVN